MPTRAAITLIVLLFITLGLASLRHRPTATGPTPEAITLAPGLRVAPSQGLVEFDGTVAIDAHHPDTPDIYLELIVTAPDTREHEALVVTPVRPSLIHAALLASGFAPGHPGSFAWDGTTLNRFPPAGDAVTLTLLWTDPTGIERTASPTDWIRADPTSHTQMIALAPWRFAGSRLVERTIRGETRTRYDADGTGVIIGLTTFGSEVIAPERVLSPESAVDEPLYMARNDAMPLIGTPVTVRIERAD